MHKKVLILAATGLFYSIIVSSVIVLLAAVQLRSSGGSTYDTWRLNYEANRAFDNALHLTLQHAEEALKQDANSLNSSKVCLNVFFDDTGRTKSNLISSNLAGEAENARRDHIKEDTLPPDVYCLVRGYAGLNSDMLYYEPVVQNHKDEIADIKKRLAGNEEQYLDLIKGHQDFLAFNEMKTTPQRIFVLLPYDLMVLLLVMLMGALGGMVRLLREYGASNIDNPRPGDYFFIPLIGSVVAIGGYVLAKTGLLLLSSSKGEASLSPFMISLVGIVSGLLAKEVIDTIAARGRAMWEDTQHKYGGEVPTSRGGEAPKKAST